MNKGAKLVVLLVVLAAVGGVLAVKAGRGPVAAEPDARGAVAAVRAALPRLVDLGATQCIPCKAMAPILAELKQTYAGRLEVQFIDVWENRAAAEEHRIRSIPTQIFFAGDGKELFRHEGFYGREEILAKWAELGFTFAGGGAGT